MLRSMSLQPILDDIAGTVVGAATGGRVADYIPALASIDPGRFGIAVVTLDGQLCGSGEWQSPFSIQSISKVFALALVLSGDEGRGSDGLWRRVGREPSGNAFNSLMQLELEDGLPRNPFINAGALVVTDRLVTQVGDAPGELVGFLNREVPYGFVVDETVASSEALTGHRNAALAHFLASHDRLDNPVATVLSAYYRQCAIRASCSALAVAGLFLARHGVLADGRRLLSDRDAQRMNAVMVTCGTYDAAGEFAYRVGLPGKSGVGGGVLAIVPGRGCICAWGPALDRNGNSIAAFDALDRLTTSTGWSIF